MTFIAVNNRPTPRLAGLALLMAGLTLQVAQPVVAGQTAAPPDSVFTGVLSSELRLDLGSVSVESLTRIPLSTLSRMPVSSARIVHAYEGHMLFGEHEIRVIEVCKQSGPPEFLVDRNLDGRFDDSESFRAVPSASSDSVRYEVVTSIRMRGLAFEEYPLRILSVDDSGSTPLSDGAVNGRELLYQIDSHVRASVALPDRNLMLEFPIEPTAMGLEIDRCEHRVDVDGNGVIDRGDFSLEVALSRGESPVFRIDDWFLSVSKVRLKSCEVEVRLRAGSAYSRIEVVPGAAMPRLACRDLAGNAIDTDAFKGKVLLIEFWASWCAPCVPELKHLKDALARFPSSDFAIVGISADESREAVEKYVRRYDVTWPQADPSTVEDLVRNKLMVRAFPSAILLDRDGTVVSTGAGALRLRGPKLIQTLERFIGRSQAR